MSYYPYLNTIYSNSQYSNVPRDPPQQDGYSYLRGSRPQTTFPYDAAYDPTYQQDRVNPQYRYYQHYEYPAWVQRHNPPKVTSQNFVNPKPVTYTLDGYEYKIPAYPPYMYWYPNPIDCKDVCGKQVCDNYYKRRNDFYNCQRCQLVQSPGPMCWNSNLQKCVPCSREKALAPCEETYGCANPNGFPHNKVAPINPLYTGCTNCL